MSNELTPNERARLDQWTPMSPPSDFADRVLAARSDAVVIAKPRRYRMFAAVSAVAVAAVVVLSMFMVRTRSSSETSMATRSDSRGQYDSPATVEVPTPEPAVSMTPPTTTPPTTTPPQTVKPASGRINVAVTLDEKPAAGLKIFIDPGGVSLTTDLGGRTATNLPVGDYTLRLDATKAAGSLTIHVAANSNKVYRIKARSDAKLAEPLAHGQLRVLVRLAGGTAIAGARLTIQPGGTDVTTGADGSATVSLAPGAYKATASASGRTDTTIDLVIEPDGVTIKVIELP